MKTTAFVIADWFIAHNESVMKYNSADEISNLKIQKLLYYAQGYIRAIRLNMIRRNGEIKDSAFKSKRGGQEGAKQERERVAADLLKEGGMSASFISKISKLPEDAVHKLAKTLGVAVL